MKLIHLCILGLICLSAINATSEETVQTEPSSGSETEKTESLIQTLVGESSEKFEDINQESSGSESQSLSTSPSESEGPVTKIVDGKIVTTVSPNAAVRFQKHFKKIDKYWSEPVTSVGSLLIDLNKSFLEPTDDDYTLFNSIATTDESNFWSDYNYWEVDQEDLGYAIENIVSVFKTPLQPGDILSLVSEIQQCTEGAVVGQIDSKSIDKNNQDGWKFHVQFFAATCSQKKTDKVQIFVWAASKKGHYLADQYSNSNSKTISSIMRVWLLSNIPLLVTCSTATPVKPMHVWGGVEDSINEPFESITQSLSESSQESSSTPTEEASHSIHKLDKLSSEESTMMTDSSTLTEMSSFSYHD